MGGRVSHGEMLPQARVKKAWTGGSKRGREEGAGGARSRACWHRGEQNHRKCSRPGSAVAALRRNTHLFVVVADWSVVLLFLIVVYLYLVVIPNFILILGVCK